MNRQLMRRSKVILFAVVTTAVLLAHSGHLRAVESQKLLKDTPFEEIVAKAKAGDAEAQLYLAKGHALIIGGVPYNKQDSHRWYIAAATNNVPEAQFYLGEFYYREVTTTKGLTQKDKAKREQSAAASLNWLAKAAKQGSFNAWVMLGNAFEDGTVFAKDLVEAYKWYHLAIEKGTNPIFAPVTKRNALSLRLKPEQIELAKRRALDFWEAQGVEKKPTAPK